MKVNFRAKNIGVPVNDMYNPAADAPMKILTVDFEDSSVGEHSLSKTISDRECNVVGYEILSSGYSFAMSFEGIERYREIDVCREWWKDLKEKGFKEQPEVEL